MKLGILAGYSGRKFNIAMDAIKHAENLGYDSLWTAEAYGSDAVTPAAWILGANRTSEGWYRHHADACAVACHGCHDGHESGLSFPVADLSVVWARPVLRWLRAGTEFPMASP
jgi:hypothetical protein